MSAGHKRRMLTSFSIMFILLLAIAILSLVMSRFTSEVTAVPFGDLMMSPVNGFKDGLGVALFVFVLGGFLAIVNKTDALSAGIGALVRKMGGNELKLIPVLMLIFAILGSTYGFCEETVGFYALLSATMMAAGFDALTGAMMVLLGAGVGCLGSTVNPFATGIAADVLASSGIVADQGVVIGLGLVLLVTSYLVSVYFVMRYAKGVRADRRRTLMSADEVAASEEAYGDTTAVGNQYEPLSRKQKVVLWLFGLSFLVMIVGFVPWGKLGIDAFSAGSRSHEVTETVTAKDIERQYEADKLGRLSVTPKDAKGTLTNEVVDDAGWSSFLTGVPLGEWYFAESTTWFLVMAIVIGIAAGFDEHELVFTFLSGCGEMTGVVMIVGLSRGVAILMGQTGLSLYVLHQVAAALNGTSPVVFAAGSYVLYFLLSILIPGTSSMATISMPIMGPLTQSLGFNPAIMINVFASASGVVNYFTPANGAIMGGLALSRVEYGTWLKFVGKVVLVTAIVNVAVLAVAMVVL